MDRVLSGAALEMKTRCIEMTPFYHCKKAELPDTKGGAPIRATVGNAPTGGLLLTLPRDVELPLRTPIEVTFYDPLLGVVRCRCSLFAPIPAGGNGGKKAAAAADHAQKGVVKGHFNGGTQWELNIPGEGEQKTAGGGVAHRRTDRRAAFRIRELRFFAVIKWSHLDAPRFHFQGCA